MHKNSKIKFLLEISFLFFVILHFLSLGGDFITHIQLRMILGVLLVLGFLVFYRDELRVVFKSVSIWFFAIFLLFEIIRAFMGSSSSIPLHGLKIAACEWTLTFAVFLMSYVLFSSKESAQRLNWTLGITAFFLAMNALPPLLQDHQYGYYPANALNCFFYPSFYFQPWVQKYLLAQIVHINNIGDLLALGFFPMLGISFYCFQSFRDRGFFTSIAAGFLSLTFAAIIGGTILLFFSRGTIVFFVLSLILYMIILLVKFKSWKLILLGFVLMFVGLGTVGNLGRAWKEVRTIEKESEKGSLGTNQEGARRAKKMYLSHALWGVGTRNYSEFSLSYATPDIQGDYQFAKYNAMNHYLQKLAEEGFGAYFYFLLLIAYFFEMIRAAISTKSRFQFISALSLSIPVLMVLGHGLINNVLEHYTFLILVFVMMGASLGILRKDFRHVA
jgi:hypothetical protein